MITLSINNNTHEVNVDPAMPLLWVLRDHLGLTGTKYGCGVALCGACTVHLNGEPVRSCQIRTRHDRQGRVTTIEGGRPERWRRRFSRSGSEMAWCSAATASPGRS